MKKNEEIKKMCYMLNITPTLWYNWKKKKTPFVEFIEKYLTYDDMLEIVQEGKINRLERLEELLEIEKKYIQISEITQNVFNYNLIDVEEIIDKLFDYYKAVNEVELSKKMGITNSTISRWRKDKAVEAVKRKCRRLGIYNEIFKNLKKE